MGFSTTGFLEVLALAALGTTTGFLVDEEGLIISLKGGEGGRGEGDRTTTGGSSFGITTGGGGITFGIAAHVRGTVAGLGSGVVAVVVLDEAAGVAFKVVAGRLLG